MLSAIGEAPVSNLNDSALVDATLAQSIINEPGRYRPWFTL